MKIVVAPDSFKGSLSSIEIIEILKDSAKKVFDDVSVLGVPVADGGEGTCDSLIYACNGTKKTYVVKDPFFKDIDSAFGVISDTAIVEMAMASGLTLIDRYKRNPMNTTTYGTGQLIKKAMDDGFRKITIGIGGSATNDGGIGAMIALGAKFYDKNNNLIEIGCGKDLINISKIDLSEFDERAKSCEFSVMCDVTNPLTGKDGATYVYGKQKGADESMQDELEKGMLNYQTIINELFGYDVGSVSGAGAAGGLGAALVAFLDAKLVSGIDEVLKISDFENKITDADLIVTGEGRIDVQSAFGKVIHGITEYANKANVPVIAIAGGVSKGYEKAYDIGIKSIFTLPNRPMGLEQCMKESKKLLSRLSLDIFSTIKIGMK